MNLIASPFPESGYPLVWEWLHEFPEANFDDDTFRTFDEFTEGMRLRAETERTWGIAHEGRLCGIVAYLPVTARLGTFHGICFSRTVHGKGIAREAVRRVLEELFASGVEKVQAGFFADNRRVHRFLANLGAVDEGLFRKQTVRGGIAIDMQLVAFFKG